MKDILKAVVFIGLFAVPFLTLYVENTYFFPYITGKNFLFRIIVEIVFAAWAVLALYEVNYRPKFSWLLASFGGFMLVMLAATFNAEHFSTAMWSNFERMDGYVTLIHVFMYFVVMGSVMTTPKLWSYFLHTSLVVAGIAALKGLSQLSGTDVRIDSYLGNAAYMAVYMLFHIFFVIYLFLQTRVLPYKIVYVFLGLIFMFVLLQTGTRGTALGLAAGLVSLVGYIALFGARYKNVQKYAIGSFVGLLLLIGGFVAVRDTAYIQNNQAFSRIANIDLSKDLSVRSIIWGMAVEGIKEKPLLGWGQGNFNYVFNSQFDPRLYGQEQWFDRVHNIVFDWLIAGGILGFIAYVSIFASLLFYLVVRPLRKMESNFSVLEQGVLFGLVVGYVTHNLVVFDNIISYIFFGTLLALIHSRVATNIPKVMAYKMPVPVIAQVVLPVVVVLTGVVVYFVNVPNMQASGEVIVALNGKTVQERLDGFELALSRDSFARQEITEQFAQQAMGIYRAQDKIDPAVKEKFLTRAEEELQNMVVAKPNDARLHVFLASYYRTIGDFDQARTEMATARKLSPKKQSIILQQGAIELSVGKNEDARDFFKEAYELDENNQEAKEYYVAALFYTKETDLAKSIIDSSTDEFKARMAASDFVVSSVNQAQDFEYLASLYEQRVKTDPTSGQSWASLAFVYYQLKQNDVAIATLDKAMVAVPAFATTAQCFVKNIKAGKTPQEGC